MLSFHKLTCTVNNKNLFNSLSVTLLPSSVTYLQGPNGSGKTSLLRIIASLQRPTSGKVFFYKDDVNELSKPYCTYIGHKFGLKLELTVFENLKFWSEIYNSTEALEASIHYFQLHDILDKKCYELSAGSQKKIALSKLLSCQSDLWLLDEVESNLDQTNKELLNALIVSKASNGGIVLIASHEKPLIKSSSVLNLKDYGL